MRNRTIRPNMTVFVKDLNYISEKIQELGNKNKLVLFLLDAIADLYKAEKMDKYQLIFYRRILRSLIDLKFGNERLFITNFKEVYPNEYPTNKMISLNGFEQYEVVMDKSKQPMEIAIVLDLFEPTKHKKYQFLEQDIRLDTNGVVDTRKVRKMDLREFMLAMDLSKEFHVKLIKGLLIE